MGWILAAIILMVASYLVFYRPSKKSAPPRVVRKGEPMVLVYPPSVESLAISIAKTVAAPDSASTIEKWEHKEDNWEKFDFFAATRMQAIGRYAIVYEDQRGLRTRREIHVKRVHKGAANSAIDAHCMVRRAHRTFISARIEECVNLGTGAYVDDLAQDAISQHLESPVGVVERALALNSVGVDVLLFASRADGKMFAAERALTGEYVAEQASRLSPSTKILDEKIKDLPHVDHALFTKHIRQIRSTASVAQIQKLFSYSTRIVETQKTVQPMQRAALEMLQAALSAALQTSKKAAKWSLLRAPHLYRSIAA